MPPDLLLIVCDTARADAFEPWGAPHRSHTMDRLCREGIAYRHACAPAPWTVPSTASMFCGRLPTEHGITGECFEWHDRKPTSPAEAVQAYAGPWLPESLRERGYRTWGVSCNSWVSAWGGFDRGFEEFLDVRPWARRRGTWDRLAYRARKGFGLTDRGGREAADRFRERLSRTNGEPLFAFVNLMETHAPLNPPRPYYPYPAWKRARTNKLAGGPDQGLSFNARVVEPGPKYVRTLRDLYYGAARYEDRVLGSFVRAVEDRGRRTVVVILADHGEHLGEHGLFNHNSSLGQPVLHVPLVAWGHRVNVGSGWVDEPVAILELAGWLRSLAEGDRTPLSGGGPVISEYEGTAQHNGIPAHIEARIRERDDPDLPALISHPGMAARKGSLKYVAVANGEERLYDLSVDPGEDHDVLPGRNDAAAQWFRPFRGAWARRRAERPVYRTGDAAEGEIADHLRALGYVE
jgi:arylsulfatase A-like enzyme